LEKLRNSERRLLQDKEGLSNQLRVQTEVRTALIALMNTALYTCTFILENHISSQECHLS
jgi:hypothetical protein